jgi:hypothetical protein
VSDRDGWIHEIKSEELLKAIGRMVGNPSGGRAPLSPLTAVPTAEDGTPIPGRWDANRASRASRTRRSPNLTPASTAGKTLASGTCTAPLTARPCHSLSSQRSGHLRRLLAAVWLATPLAVVILTVAALSRSQPRPLVSDASDVALVWLLVTAALVGRKWART